MSSVDIGFSVMGPVVPAQTPLYVYEQGHNQPVVLRAGLVPCDSNPENRERAKRGGKVIIWWYWSQ